MVNNINEQFGKKEEETEQNSGMQQQIQRGRLREKD